MPKKENKILQKENTRKSKNNLLKWSAALVGTALLFVGGFYLYQEFTRPLPGQQVEDLGREHVPQEEWEKFKYNSNPPTSGPHDVVWTRPGIYEEPQGDGHLVHSLEHGYIIISYNCAPQSGREQEEDSTESAEMISEAFSSDECEDLKQQLSDLANEKKLWKLIVVPRPSLDSEIALTAWGRINKLNSFDKERISQFVDALRNHGPEQTME